MEKNNLNLILAVLLALAIMFGWQHFYEKPRLNALTKQHNSYNKKIKKAKVRSADEFQGFVNRQSATNSLGRVKISTPKLQGSISLKGMRFDDIILPDYKDNLNDNSKNVELFSPSNTENAYFAEIGFHSEFAGTTLPGPNTVWKADRKVLEVGNPVTFTWINSDDVRFIVKANIDQNYMFSVEQRIENASSKPISARPYGLINRIHTPKDSMTTILHEGPLSVVNESLEDLSYDKIKDKKSKKFEKAKLDWIGITDKYWLAALIPDQRYEYVSNYSYGLVGGKDKYQVDFLGPQNVLEPGDSIEFNNLLFTGAKKVDLLDKYEMEHNIKLFDRAIDFGIFYIITKPLFHALNFFYQYFGNFGISILMVTVIIKLLMFSVANKSYKSMRKMRNLAPQIERIKDLYAEDKTRMNQEVMELYKKEKVNPVSGCLPLLLQIPVFFSIYKVLYVTIEMRHAPFYGWIMDLSAPDPTSIFNLFGLLAWNPPSFLMIGVWPILMSFTMFLQQKMSPEPTDPAQAMMIKLMPLMFLVMFSSFPAGLVIYWTWNNILSAAQQYVINRSNK